MYIYIYKEHVDICKHANLCKYASIPRSTLYVVLPVGCLPGWLAVCISVLYVCTNTRIHACTYVYMRMHVSMYISCNITLFVEQSLQRFQSISNHSRVISLFCLEFENPTALFPMNPLPHNSMAVDLI